MTVESQMILIFGATGDLARRKLIPSLYHLVRKNRLTDCTPIICIGRRVLSSEQYISQLDVERFIGDAEPLSLARLLGRIEYIRFDASTETTEDFVCRIAAIQKQYSCTSNMLIYLALPTRIFQQTADLISGLGSQNGWKRVVFEKPFGENLKSARQLNATIRTVLEEDEIYRVDHYLGKALVQNILTLRFSNEIFSRCWDRGAIDHVQITVSETLGVENRAGYYDQSGAVRDMIQNHLLQLLSLVAMEPPGRDSSDSLRDRAVAVLRNLRPLAPQDIVLGQYGSGTVQATRVDGYLMEKGVAEGSTTETYAALRVFVDTERWRQVPFYLRTGKRLKARHADIRIVFRQQHHVIGGRGEPNVVIIRIQPDEGIALTMNVQTPGEEFATESVMMDFCHHCYFGPNTPEAYESILQNVIEGDRTLFPRWDWIEASWQYIDQLRTIAATPVIYPAGSQGPDQAGQLLAADGRQWLDDVAAAKLVSLPDMR
jgi:glucose-6-phosphate 1-dehydrogenase